jgi:hypothetical protein
MRDALDVETFNPFFFFFYRDVNLAPISMELKLANMRGY